MKLPWLLIAAISGLVVLVLAIVFRQQLAESTCEDILGGLALGCLLGVLDLLVRKRRER